MPPSSSPVRVQQSSGALIWVYFLPNLHKHLCIHIILLRHPPAHHSTVHRKAALSGHTTGRKHDEQPGTPKSSLSRDRPTRPHARARQDRHSRQVFWFTKHFTSTGHRFTKAQYLTVSPGTQGQALNTSKRHNNGAMQGKETQKAGFQGLLDTPRVQDTGSQGHNISWHTEVGTNTSKAQ